MAAGPLLHGDKSAFPPKGVATFNCIMGVDTG